MLVDLTTSKRFTYNKNIHFATDTIQQKIVLSDKKIAMMPKNTFMLYTSPLQTIDIFSIQMATLGIEFFIKNNISISTEYGTKIDDIHRKNINIYFLEEKANTYRFEAKWYNKTNFTKNVHTNEYFGLEFRKINNQYNNNINYYQKSSNNQNNFITDDFATKKTVLIINFKYGYLIPIGKIFYLDFYTGFGIRNKRFNHINLEYNSNIHKIRFEEEFFNFLYVRDFKNYTNKSFLNLSLGFKFGIKL